jgi:fimbrial chaperone protein
MNERFPGKAVVCTVFLFIFGGLAPQAEAQVSISPVRIDLGEENSKDVIRISSQSDEARSYQVEIVAWSQTAEEREVYTPTEDVLAVPPLFTIAPGEEQVVRVGMVTDPDPKTERAYRMFITELASPEQAQRESSGVNMRLRLGVPVFVAPQSPAIAALDHVGWHQADGRHFMQMRNTGNTHVRISEVRYRAPGMDEPEVEAAAIYVLAGESGYVPVPLPDGEREGSVAMVTDTLGITEYDLSAAL